MVLLTVSGLRKGYRIWENENNFLSALISIAKKGLQEHNYNLGYRSSFFEIAFQ